jgi:hypothetical protein
MEITVADTAAKLKGAEKLELKEFKIATPSIVQQFIDASAEYDRYFSWFIEASASVNPEQERKIRRAVSGILPERAPSFFQSRKKLVKIEHGIKTVRQTLVLRADIVSAQRLTSAVINDVWGVKNPVL